MLPKPVAFAEFLRRFHQDGTKIGATQHSVLFRQNKSCVRCFEPSERRGAPLFISMPLINSWAVFDLLPHRSVVAGLVEQGIPVYLLDWGAPGPEDAEVDVEDLLALLHRAVDRSRRHARERWDVDVLDGLGYCVGGTFLAAYCALEPDTFQKVALLASPIDFAHAGRLSRWADPETFPVDALVDNYGNFPAELMATSFAWLAPMGQARKWKALWERFEESSFKEVWAALETWNGEHVDFWGEAYRSYIRSCYFDNALMREGWSIGGRVADLRNATAPLQVFAASHDHICPTDAAFAVEDVWGGTVQCTELEGGHVGICLSTRLVDALATWSLGADA